MKPEIKTLKNWIAESDNIVFFGGAGVSTESGLADFRSRDGIYSRKYDFPYPAEQMLSHSFFMAHTAEFFDFQRKMMINRDVRPNKAHLRLAELELEGKLSVVITQNIDNLHQMAGSRNVLELHGSCYRNYCMNCGKFYPIAAVTDSEGVPYCDCGGIIKPDVVLYEEPLDSEVFSAAIDAIKSCDMLIVGGTSLSVYPAAGLINYYKGHKLVLINSSSTPYDGNADLLIAEKIGAVFAQIQQIDLRRKYCFQNWSFAMLDLRFRLSQMDDLNAVEHMFQRAITHMNEKNIHQWDAVYPNRSDFYSDINKRQLYLGFSGDTLCSAFVLNKDCDAAYANGRWHFPDAAFLVIHRLAVDPAFQDQGIGKRTMLYSEDLSKRAGAATLRLDTFSQNPNALRLYESLGYTRVGEAHWRKGIFYLYEKSLIQLFSQIRANRQVSLAGQSDCQRTQSWVL